MRRVTANFIIYWMSTTVFGKVIVLKTSNCEYTENKSLTYTIPRATRADTGQYTCTVEAKEGHGLASSTVTVGDCEVQAQGHVEGNQVQCSFSGVYTKGEVHWFTSTQNMTSDIPDEIVKDQRGLFNISSTLSIPDIREQHRYNCSLWIPREGYVISYEPISSMDKNKLSWILMFLSLILVC
ncbi:hypothetical protein SRHO_G00200730 [Serrasalmus rhombeus]